MKADKGKAGVLSYYTWSGMQQSRPPNAQAQALGNNNDHLLFPPPTSNDASFKGGSSLSAASSSSSVTIYPSRLPQQAENQRPPQQPQRRLLQRQKDIDTLFQRSTSESLPDNELTAAQVTSCSSVLTTSQRRGGSRPLLQRQQRQSSEESTKSNVHFKEDPEYFEVDNASASSPASSIVRSARRPGIYDPVRNVVSEQKNLTSLAATSTHQTQGLARLCIFRLGAFFSKYDTNLFFTDDKYDSNDAH